MRQLFVQYNESRILQPVIGEIRWPKHLIVLGKCKEIEKMKIPPRQENRSNISSFVSTTIRARIGKIVGVTRHSTVSDFSSEVSPDFFFLSY